jgi:hypothetical protein
MRITVASKGRVSAEKPRSNRDVNVMPPLRRLAHWINEREAIREARERGDNSPWTADPILQEWKFCNVRREDDRVTKAIKNLWRDPYAKDKSLWHAMVVARFINWPDTLEECGYPEPWPKKQDKFMASMHAREARGDKVFTGAYIVSNNGMACSKIGVVHVTFNRASYMPAPPQVGDTLQEAYRKLIAVDGIGSFMAAQVIADLKHTPVLRKAKDWHDWAAPGKGSMRGLNRVYDLPITKQWKERMFVQRLAELRKELLPHAPIVGSICLQDLQNCLCEFDKWERVRLGEGKPRARYTPYGG